MSPDSKLSPLDCSNDSGYSAASRSSWPKTPSSVTSNGVPSRKARSLSRSGSTISYGTKACDPFTDFLKDKEPKANKGLLSDLDDRLPGCKRELRRKATMSKLAASEDLKRWMAEKPLAWRGSRTPLPQRLLSRQELIELKESMNRSHEELCRADPEGVSHFVNSEESAQDGNCGFRAALQNAIRRNSNSSQGSDLFLVGPGQHFLSRFRQVCNTNPE
jgi:hypothetical protein